MSRVVRRGPEARQKVIDILRSGGSLDDAAAETGYGKDYCRQIGAKVGIRFERGHYKTSKQEKYNKIAELYRKGYDPQQIADLLGYKSTSSIYEALRYKRIKKRRNISLSVYEIRVCPECNTAFCCHERHNQRFCSTTCERTHSHKINDQNRRARKTDALVDLNITLEEVAKRDRDICYLCGEKVDWSDYKIVNEKKCSLGRYPSIEHVIALNNGGKHSWDNVRLAHISCNAKKGVKAVG